MLFRSLRCCRHHGRSRQVRGRAEPWAAEPWAAEPWAAAERRVAVRGRAAGPSGLAAVAESSGASPREAWRAVPGLPEPERGLAVQRRVVEPGWGLRGRWATVKGSASRAPQQEEEEGAAARIPRIFRAKRAAHSATVKESEAVCIRALRLFENLTRLKIPAVEASDRDARIAVTSGRALAVRARLNFCDEPSPPERGNYVAKNRVSRHKLPRHNSTSDENPRRQSPWATQPVLSAPRPMIIFG